MPLKAAAPWHRRFRKFRGVSGDTQRVASDSRRPRGSGAKRGRGRPRYNVGRASSPVRLPKTARIWDVTDVSAEVRPLPDEGGGHPSLTAGGVAPHLR